MEKVEKHCLIGKSFYIHASISASETMDRVG
jgi:hypothetical protein